MSSNPWDLFFTEDFDSDYQKRIEFANIFDKAIERIRISSDPATLDGIVSCPRDARFKTLFLEQGQHRILFTILVDVHMVRFDHCY